ELSLRIRGLRRPSSDGGKVDIAAQRPADVAAFPATQDAVDDLEVGSTARFDDVGTGAVAAERLSIVCDYDSRLSLRVLAAGGTVKVEALQDRVDVRREFQRAEYGFRGAVSRGGLVYLLAAIADERNHGRRFLVRTRRHLQRLQYPRPAGGAVDVENDRLNIAVVHVLFSVCEFLEFLERTIGFKLVKVESQFPHPHAECVSAAVLAEDEVRLAEADLFRAHDLVGGTVLQHAMLVYAGLMRKRVLTNHRLVARDVHPGDPGHQPRSGIEAGGIHAGTKVKELGTGRERHHHFLERAVAGTFADSVDRALDLAGAGCYGREAVCYRHPQIVVAVHAERHVVDPRDVLFQVPEQPVKLRWHGIADRI